jgi:hypothetical protein
MPVINGIGTSKNTPIKDEHFTSILKTHLSICKVIIDKNIDKGWLNNKYLYIDLNAGSGRVDDEGLGSGSPVIFIAQATKILNGFWKARFVEKNKLSAESLALYLNTMFNGDYEVFVGDNKDFLRQYSAREYIQRRKSYGLIYCDPNNHDVPTAELSTFFDLPAYRYLDIMIHRNCTSAKRVNASPFCQHVPTVQEITEQIPKNFWLIREPFTAHHFTFMIGTNWDSFPKFKGLGFEDSKSEAGKKLVEKLSFPKTPKKPRPPFPYVQGNKRTRAKYRYDPIKLEFLIHDNRNPYLTPGQRATYLAEHLLNIEDTGYFGEQMSIINICKLTKTSPSFVNFALRLLKHGKIEEIQAIENGDKSLEGTYNSILKEGGFDK